MFNKIVSQADLSSLITLAEVKRHCNVLEDFDDDYLTSLIPVACELAQTYCHKLLTLGSVSIESLEYRNQVLLPWGNVSSITSVTLDGATYTDYTFHEISQILEIPDYYEKLEVTYECGYSTIPAAVKQGIVMLISTMYNYRDDVIAGYTLADIPLSSKRLLDRARYYHV